MGMQIQGDTGFCGPRIRRRREVWDPERAWKKETDSLSRITLTRIGQTPMGGKFIAEAWWSQRESNPDSIEPADHPSTRLSSDKNSENNSDFADCDSPPTTGKTEEK